METDQLYMFYNLDFNILLEIDDNLRNRKCLPTMFIVYIALCKHENSKATNEVIVQTRVRFLNTDKQVENTRRSRVF